MKKSNLLLLTILTIVLTACSSAAVQSTPVTVQSTLVAVSVTSTAGTTPIPTSTNANPAVSTETPITGGISFTNDVLPILQSRCLNCHGGEQTKEGLSFASYETLMAGSINGAVIVPGDAEGSLLIQLVSNGKMPKRGPKLTPEQIRIIFDWIMAGALNN